MIRVNNLNITNIIENRLLVKDLSFEVNYGDKIAIIGEEGNGKSTLLKALMKYDLKDFEVKGEILIDGKIGYLEQESKLVWAKEDVIDFLLKQHIDDQLDIETYNRLEKLDFLLAKVYFNMERFDKNKNIDEFSGGEVVKLALVKLMLQEVDVMMIDEPSNDLDLHTISFLSDFINKENIPIIFISHDEALLNSVSTGVIHLMQTKKKKEPISIFMNVPYEVYKQERLATFRSQKMIANKQRAEYKKKMEKFNQIYQKVEFAQDQAVRDPTTGRLLKKRMHVLKSQQKRYEKEAENFVDIPQQDELMNLFFDKDVIVANNKKIIDFHGEIKMKETVLVKEVNFTVYGPKHIAIIGDNGVGKTTFLKALQKGLSNTNGIIVGYVPQNYSEALFEKFTPLSFLRKNLDINEEANIRKILGNLLFTREEMVSKINKLSGGTKAKLLILKLIIEKANVLLLDEPTRNLSPLSAPVIYDLLNSFKGTIICVTHDKTFIENVFDDVYLLDKSGLNKLT